MLRRTEELLKGEQWKEEMPVWERVGAWLDARSSPRYGPPSPPWFGPFPPCGSPPLYEPSPLYSSSPLAHERSLLG